MRFKYPTPSSIVTTFHALSLQILRHRFMKPVH
jgi:hypothetical protein